MLQLSNLSIPDNAWLIVGAVTCLVFNAHGLVLIRSFLTIATWIDKHGPLITLQLGLRKFVVIGHYKAAMDIMENQDAALADHPHMIAAGEIFSSRQGLTSTPFGEKSHWKHSYFSTCHRALHMHLQPKAAEAYQPLLMPHVKNLVLEILDDQHNFQNHVINFSLTTMMKVTYGTTTPTSVTNPLVKEMYQLMKVVRKLLRPNAFYLMDLIPWLKHIPCVQAVLQQGDVDIGPSFTRFMLENSDHYGLTEVKTAFLSAAFFGAGSDTTTLALCNMLLAATCFPEEQGKVQVKLNAVIGRHQAPNFADQQSLTCLHTFISEALRWRPVAPNNSEVFPEPNTFKPQCWIDDQGHLRDDLNNFLFGFGWCICPGQHIANRSVFIGVVLILWAFWLHLDPTQPLDDIGFLDSEKTHWPCSIKFKLRIPDAELRHKMKSYPEVVSVDETDHC
ncbi:cytochrome P450 [Suillus hirtellus]|nr:cytochrome P450 [Suillus hirtellus]